MGPRLKPLFDAQAAQIWTGDYNRDKGQRRTHLPVLWIHIDFIDFRPMRIQGFVEEK
jgi:hypothetical protein